MEMDLYYRGRHIGTRRVDFSIEGSFILVIKAIEKLECLHWPRLLIIERPTTLKMVYY